MATAPKDALSIQTQRVSAYILQLLRGEPVTGPQVKRALTPAAYAALQPAIWALLNSVAQRHPDISSAVLHAAVEHATKTSSKAALKRLTIEFVARLILVRGGACLSFAPALFCTALSF